MTASGAPRLSSVTGGILPALGLTDARDQYELVANFAARRKRACMEAIIPRDIIDAAVEQCDKTLKAGHTEPLTDRIRKMASAFAEYGVTVPMIEKRLQHKLEACIEQELVLLRKIFVSLKDGMSKREDWFDVYAAEITRPKFDGEPANPDTQAESAAGLAPAQTSSPAEQPKRGRKKAAEAQPAQAAAPAPVQPGVSNKATDGGGVATLKPEAEQGVQLSRPGPAPAAPAQSAFAALASEAYNQLRTCMEHSQITDTRRSSGRTGGTNMPLRC